MQKTEKDNNPASPGNLRKRTTAAIYDVTGVVIPKENAVGLFG
jgi:hypothetical protein